MLACLVCIGVVLGTFRKLVLFMNCAEHFINCTALAPVCSSNPSPNSIPAPSLAPTLALSLTQALALSLTLTLALSLTLTLALSLTQTVALSLT